MAFIDFIAPGKILFKVASPTDGAIRTLASSQTVGDQADFALDGSAALYHDSSNPVASIWKIDFKTGAQTRMTFGSTSAGFGHFSPDGKWISFQVAKQNDTEIAVMPSAGGKPEIVWDKPGRWFNGDWTPDSESIVIAGDDGSGWALYTLSRRTHRMQKLTRELTMRMYLRYPRWSPDGKNIVYEFNESKGNVFLAELP